MNYNDVRDLMERAKELRCIYAVDGIVGDTKLSLDEALQTMIRIIPFGFQEPPACRCKLTVLDRTFELCDFSRAKELYACPVYSSGKEIGKLQIGYIEAQLENKPAILDEEIKMMEAIAARISNLIEKRRNNFLSDRESWKTENHWHWRHFMAQQIADSMDMERYGVQGIYLFGSTDRGNSGMGSDIDLILHVNQTPEQRKMLENWLDGWSRSLAKINYLHTGYDMEKLLDIHFLSDTDIEAGDIYALKLTSTAEPVTLLREREY